MRRLIHLAVLSVLVGCAGGGFPTSDVTPTEIPALERRLSADPDDAAAMVRLGVAYHKAGDAEQARKTLAEAARLPGAPVEAWAYLGAVAEEQGDYHAARRAYEAYMERGGRTAREAVASRLAYVRRQALVQEARRALAREAELTAQAPDPDLVAVMPLVVEGPEEYAALGRGLAEMLATDLGLTDRLRVLERARLQALLNEMKLGLAGYTDPETAARAGRLLRAGRMVQGRVLIPAEDDDPARLQAVLVNAARPADVRQAGEEGAMDALLDLEVELALALYRQLGVELTEAERARLREKPTRSLQAFLEYSRGLEAMDRGDYSQAMQRFNRAAEMDPDFNEARQQASVAEQLSAATETAPATVASTAGQEVAQSTGGTSTSDGGGASTQSTLNHLTQSAAPAGAGAVTETATAATDGATDDGTPQTSGPPASTRQKKTAGEHQPTQTKKVKITIPRTPPPSSSSSSGGRP